MITVEQPYIEMSFYFTDAENRIKHLDKMTAELLRLGASFSGTCIVSTRINEGIAPIKNVDSEELRPISELSIDSNSWKEILHNSQNYVHKIGMLNATGFKNQLLESVGNGYIDHRYIHQDHPPLSIAMSYENLRKELKEATGNESTFSRRFRHLSDLLAPAYAAICYIEPLPCLAGLRGQQFFNFSNFFVNRNIVSKDVLARIKTIYANAYILEMKNGIYISTTEEFNPNNIHIQLEFEHQEHVLDILAEGIQSI